MDYAVIQNNLKNEEIHPKALIETYRKLLIDDIAVFFSQEKLIAQGCPTNEESEVSGVFHKMGFQYLKSRTFGNLYLSPRPSYTNLLKFYRNGKARKFWYENLFRETEISRREKILDSHFDWIHATAVEHGFKANRKIAEINPVLWSYYSLFTSTKYGDTYTLVDPLFAPEWAQGAVTAAHISEGIQGTFDLVCLFGALNRSVDPRNTLLETNRSLSKNGLCFITDFLSSGFEIQTLGMDSSVILPPEKLNLFSYEGLEQLARDCGFEILEFSTPGLLDVENVLSYFNADPKQSNPFFQYIAEHRQNTELANDLQNFLQVHKLSSIARLVLRKK